MDYEAYKSAAMGELTPGARGSKPIRQRAEKTSSLSLICAMLIAATIGFYSTRIDLQQVSSRVSGKHEVMDSMLALVGLQSEQSNLTPEAPAKLPHDRQATQD